jgi:hypothetical protein
MPARAHPEWLTWGFKFTNNYFSHHIRIRQARLVLRICCPCTCPGLSHVPRVARVHTCPAHVPTCPATARVRTFLLLFTCTCPDLSRTCSKSSAHVQTCPHLPHVARVYTCPAHVPTCPATARVRTCLPVHVQTCPGTARVLSRVHMSRPVPRPHVPVPVVLLKSRRRPVPHACLP